MKQSLFYLLLLTLLIGGCSYHPPAPVKVAPLPKKISYLADVKPIFDRKCTTCHSCYNSPCQLKLSSFEGVERGGSKEAVYLATRLRTQDPTRLFIDAQSTEEWRRKKFFSVTESSAEEGYNDSTMLQLLDLKKRNPVSTGDYYPEADDLSCVSNGNELGEYVEKHPNRGMPFGFPELSEEEYAVIATWLQQGAPGPTPKEQKKLTEPSVRAALHINKWETFFNQRDAKHAMTARYLYEHFFLAHIHFEETPESEFYELVRSKTPPGEPIEIIATVRPYDDPGVEQVYYRFRKIHSTIVHKTHMVVTFNDAKMARFKAQFIGTKWLEEPHFVVFDTKLGANPFMVYKQIPPLIRYQFLLDHAEYIIRTFIRGPVCKGQIALNVIHDHFWVMFMDPKYDLTVQHPEFIIAQEKNLRLPTEQGSGGRVRSAFSDAYRDRYARFYDAKMAMYEKEYPDGLGMETIWPGGRADDAPLLTVYRHFDSASVHKGVLGDLPRTLWTIDYSQFERIYYALVAGFDVFGNVTHQTNVRRYMDYLRIEGELNFLHFLPNEVRLPMIQSWYIGDSVFDNVKYEDTRGVIGTKIDYRTDDPKRELVERIVNDHIRKETDITFDLVNYHAADEKPPVLPQTYRTEMDYINGFRALTAPGTGFIRHINSYNINVLYMRIRNVEGRDRFVSIVINRWHDNVNALFNEKKRLDSSKDTIDFFPYSIGSYPNYFVDIDFSELPEFFDLMANFERTEYYMNLIRKFGINRADPKFWDGFKWFQDHFNQRDPLNAGLYDLNRYYYKAW